MCMYNICTYTAHKIVQYLGTEREPTNTYSQHSHIDLAAEVHVHVYTYNYYCAVHTLYV